MRRRHVAGVRTLAILASGLMAFGITERAANAKKRKAPKAKPTVVAPVVPTLLPLPLPPPIPEMPNRLPEPLHCPTPADVAPGAEVTLRCAARATMHSRRIRLYYRAPGSETFTPVPMSRGEKGWYTGVVPASAVTGTALQVYFEALGAGDKVLDSVGTADSPSLVAIQGGEPAAAPVGPDTAPLEERAAERNRAQRNAELGLHRRAPKSLWVGAGAGLGGGWMPKRTLERRTGGEASGVASQGGLHLIPEIGYQIDDRTAFGVQLRYQRIGDEGAGDGFPGSPAHNALAVLAHVARFYREANLQVFLSATAGGGSGFRLFVAPNDDAGFLRSDTVRGGPVVLGPGAGAIYHFSDMIAAVVEARALAGLPDFAVLAELTASVQISLWTRGRGFATTDRSDPTLAD